MRKLVGQVSVEEKNTILALFERRNGLSELAKIITAENTELYEKVIKDMGETSIKFNQWWDEMSEKYEWEKHPNGGWEINFDTCNIYLTLND